MADVSSCFLSEPVNVSDYGIIYGGVQKNIGPAGMEMCIRDSSLAGLRKIKEEGVYFHSHVDGRKIFMGPEESMQIQSCLLYTSRCV